MPDRWDDIDLMTGWWIRASIIEYSNIRTLEEFEILKAQAGVT